MAVNISNTKHFKKGEKLPDGTTAKRGVVWNTKTGKRVTGKVVMTSAGSGGMGATKTYKAGRAVSAAKKKSSGKTVSSGATTSAKPTQTQSNPNAGVKVGTLRKGPRGALNRWNGSRWVRASQGSSYQAGSGQTAKSSSRGATSGTVSSAMAKKKGSYTAGTGGGSAYNKAMTKGRTSKYGAQTPGNQALSAIGKAVTSTFTTKSDAQVRANNKRVADERRRKAAATKAALKKASADRRSKGKW